MKEKLVIIDGSSLIYRAFYALPLLTNSEGIYTNAVYGFLRMLLKLYQDTAPDYIAVSFDKSRHTFRSEMYEGYKSTRKDTPAELAPQFSLLMDVLRSMGIAVFEAEGYEGDDILGTIARRYEQEQAVFIVTGDRDALQLVNEHTTVFLTKKGISQMLLMDSDAVSDTYGITPQQVVDAKALMGDASDNIPGVAGVGEKTAVNLMKQFGNLDEVYSRLNEVKGAKLKEKLAAGRESAYLSRDLARIRTDVPIETDLADMARPVHAEEMKTLFKALGFQNLLKDFSGFRRYGELLEENGKETVSQLPADIPVLPWVKGIDIKGEIVSLVPVISGTAPFYACSGAVLTTAHGVYSLDHEELQQALPALASAGAVAVEDTKALWEAGLGREDIRFFEPALAAYLLDPTRAAYPLSYLSDAFELPTLFLEEIDDPVQKCAGKGCLLADLCRPMMEALEKNRVAAVYQDIEQPLVEVLASMEMVGISTDRERWREVKADMDAREKALLTAIYAEAGEEFNVNSPKQLGIVLFEKMGMPAGKKTKTGYSTAADVLETLAAEYPFVGKILEYRTIAKLNSTYLTALDQLIRPETGRIHTSFNQTVTATGRLSSSEPNLQNIPVRTPEGRKIRSLFIPGKGYDFFVSADYSQIELRILAHMSGDENLIASFRRGEDIHRRTAAEVLGIPLEEVTPEQRSHAKAVSFGIIYGISDFGLARQLGISRKAAEDYIERYFARYPKIRQFLNGLVASARESGRAVTLSGRYRALPDIMSKNFNRRSFAERTAMNTPIQGTAADIMKTAMICVFGEMKKANLQSRILLQVHDELIVETKAAEQAEVKQILRETMEHAADLSVPLSVDIHSGTNWADTK